MIKMFSKLFLLIITLAIGIADAQTLTQKLPVDEKVKIGKLPNGLTYYIRQNKKPENKVELRLVVNAGSILEDNDQQGLAHFTEHMAFNGSKHFEKNELVSFLQSIGVEFGADLNAYTGFDETVYILPVPLTDTSNFRQALTVLQDWAGGLSFDSNQINGERGVVLEESRLGKGADDRMFRKIYPLQYAGSKYAERIPIGKDSILKTFKYDAIKRFYRNWYRPDLMAVVVVGDIDVPKTEQLIKEYFSGLKNPSKPVPRSYATVPSRQKSQAIVVTDKEATNYILEVDYPFTAEKRQITLGDYRQYLVKNLFTTLLNQRLSELSQSSTPPFLYAATGFNSFARGYEGFTGFAVAGNQGPDTALNALMLEIERAKNYGFTENELGRAKKQFLSAFEQTYNNRDKTESVSFVEEYIRNFLTKEPIPGIDKEYDYYKEFLPTIKLSEVNALTTPLKQNEKLFVSMQGPSDSTFKLPTNTALLANAQKALNAPVKPYEEKAVAAELLKTKPQPGSITNEKKNEQLGTTELTFANGVKVILKPTDFKNDEIVMSSFHKGGRAKYGADDKANATYASAVVQQMGVGDFSPTDLRKVLAGKSINVSSNIGGLSSGVSGSSSVKDIETMLQLVNLYITSPRRDEALFKAWRDKQKSAIQFQMSDPQTAFIDTFYQVLYQKNPLAPIAIPTPETFDKINLDRALSIYNEQFNDANDFNFFFVGSFNIDSLKPLLATYLGSLPSKGKPAEFIDNGVRRAQGKMNISFKKGTEPKSFILKVYSGEIPYNADLALKAQALTEIANIKITEDLREKLGAIYGGGISGGLNKLPYNNYSFALTLPCGPENVDTLLKSSNDEIEKLKTSGPEQKDLDKVKKTWIEQYKVQLKENGFWNGQLQNVYFQGDDPQRIFDYEKRVNALTVDDIKDAANQLFNDKNVLQAVLYPEK